MAYTDALIHVWSVSSDEYHLCNSHSSVNQIVPLCLTLPLVKVMELIVTNF